MNKISMKEAAKAWGEGKDVQWQDARQLWHDIGNNGFMFNQQIAYRVKPEVTTSLSEDILCGIYERHIPWPSPPGGHATWFKEALRSVADTAIKQYIKENPK